LRNSALNNKQENFGGEVSANPQPHPSVLQINVSAHGGLPKASVASVFVSKKGLSGDYNKFRMTKLSGDPTSAVLLLPVETIREFARKGYDVAAGSMGENFTLDYIRYDELSIGRRLLLGKEGVGPTIKIERVCDPCDELLVYGNDFPKAAFGKRGMYASVQSEGYVSKGDPVIFF
jgi:MOSC domain-containing protein YiiM